MPKQLDSNEPTPNPQPTPQLNPSPLPFKTAYGPKLRAALTFSEPSRTKQAFKDECDINNIMKRFSATGELTHLATRQPMYTEVPDLDFQAAMGIVVDARNRFDALPSAIRDRFGNDPAQLLAFLQDPENYAEGVKLGLLQKRPEQGVEPSTPDPVSTSKPEKGTVST